MANKKTNGTILKIKNPFQLLAWLIKYKKAKELLFGIVILLFFIIIILVIILYGYDSKKGFYKNPTETKLEYKRGNK